MCKNQTPRDAAIYVKSNTPTRLLLVDYYNLQLQLYNSKANIIFKAKTILGIQI